MRLRSQIPDPSGYSLVELLCVLAILGICLAASSISVAAGLSTNEARGAAQVWQGAAAWAQVGALWQGGSTRVRYEAGDLVVADDFGLSGGDLGASGPAAPATTNLARWRDGHAVTVSYGPLGAPDGGGSLYFQAWRGAYRVVIRPESGLTARSRVGP